MPSVESDRGVAGSHVGRGVALGNADPFVKQVRSSWRRLTGGRRVRDSERRTVVACSGGADSGALALALAGVQRDSVVLAHIVHDMRPACEATADRDAVAALADDVGLPFYEANVTVKGVRGNEEAIARDRRLAALGAIAERVEAPFVATGHHADDQLETVLMRLVRGAGPTGMAGIRECRTIQGAELVRPLLTSTRDACESACRRAGWVWCEDATNSDERRLRSAIRHRVTPELRALAPGLSDRVGRMCRLMEGAAEVVSARVSELAGSAHLADGGREWERRALAREPAIVIGQLIRDELSGWGVPADDIGGDRLESIVAAVRDPVDAPKVFEFDDMRVRVRGSAVAVIQFKEEKRDV